MKDYKNKLELYPTINEYLNKLNEEDENIQIDIMFVQKVKNKANEYKTWMFAAKNKDIIDMVMDTIENIMADILVKNLVDYDLEVSTDETIQIVEESKVVNSLKLKKAITVNYNNDNTVTNKLDYDIFDFIIIQISDNSYIKPLSKLFLYKKHIKKTAKYKGSRSFTLNEATNAKLFDKKLLIISSYADAFCIDEHFYVINRNSFNSMMNFKDLYTKVVDEGTPAIIDSQLFDKPEEFINECKNNGRYITRLTKAILADGFKKVENNKGKLKKLKSDYNLNFELTKDGKIKYNKATINEVLNLLLEHYVTSALTSDKLLALAIEKYN